MLTIRQDQIKVFREYHLQKFEDEMVEHSKAFAPPLCEIIGDGQVRVAVHAAMRKAQSYGFTNKGPIRLFVEMMFLCGSAFDTDPQYVPVGEVLRSTADQMVRAEKIHLGYLEYLEKVSGPDAINVRKALKDLSVFARKPLTFSSDNFESALLSEMTRIFPQKAAYVREPGLRALIREGESQAARHRFPASRHAALLAVLMFSFGHGCTDDPLYPWISRTLLDQKITDPLARAERLERKALTWLDHVVERNQQRGQV